MGFVVTVNLRCSVQVTRSGKQWPISVAGDKIMTGNGAAMINSKTLKNSTESWAFFYYQQKLSVAYSDIPLPYNDKKKFKVIHEEDAVQY